jgi:hypothetical protein
MRTSKKVSGELSDVWKRIGENSYKGVMWGLGSPASDNRCGSNVVDANLLISDSNGRYVIQILNRDMY